MLAYFPVPLRESSKKNNQTRSLQGQAQQFERTLYVIALVFRTSFMDSGFWDKSVLPAGPINFTQTFFDNVLLELGGLPHVFPIAVLLE